MAEEETVDLADQPEEVAAETDVAVPTFNLYRHREWTRTVLAYIIVGTVPFIVVVSLVGLLAHWAPASDIKDLSIALLGAVVGVAGAVIGFYFGERRSG